jgi:two-component system OmpR family response regulator
MSDSDDREPLRSLLIADSDPDLIDALMISLWHPRLSIESVTSGPAALIASRRRRYDAILLDAVLPFVNGYEVCGRLTEEQPDARVILMSGASEPSLEALAADLGACAYLSKPFTLAAARRAVFRVIGFSAHIRRLDPT